MNVALNPTGESSHIYTSKVSQNNKIRDDTTKYTTTIALSLQNMFRIILIHQQLLKYTNNLIEHTNMRYKIIRR